MSRPVRAMHVAVTNAFSLSSSGAFGHRTGVWCNVTVAVVWGQEVIATGRLKLLDHKLQDQKVAALLLFKNIWGLGPSGAMKLVDKGFRSGPPG